MRMTDYDYYLSTTIPCDLVTYRGRRMNLLFEINKILRYEQTQEGMRLEGRVTVKMAEEIDQIWILIERN